MFNEFAQEVYAVAKEHGWHEKPREFPECMALMVSELAEALEEYRDGSPILYFKPVYPSNLHTLPQDDQTVFSPVSYKPEGVAAELADCIIRILDYCVEADIDIDTAIIEKHNFNKTRAYRHGGKRA